MSKKVFLGGTCADSTWRSKIIPLLNIDYFNPVVDDWTPECYEEELKQRKLCDYCLYTITPKMIGVYSIAEVTDDSNKRPNKTLLITLKNDKDSEFNKAQWKSMDAVAKLVKENGSKVFTTLEDAAAWLNTHSSIE
jgi:hypothetical protein